MLLILALYLGVVGCFSSRHYYSDRRESLELRVMTYNLYEAGLPRAATTWESGRRTAFGDRMEQLVQVVQRVNPDVLMVQELRAEPEQVKQRLQQLSLAGALKHTYFDADCGGVALLSRYRIKPAASEVQGDRPGGGFLAATIRLPKGRRLVVIGVDFDWRQTPEWRGLTEDRRAEHYRQQCRILLERLRALCQQPAVLLGTLHHSPTQSFYNQEPFYDHIRSVGYIDLLELHHSHRYHAMMTYSGGEVVDYLFVSPAIKGSCRASDTAAPPVAFQASDHLSIWADLVLY